VEIARTSKNIDRWKARIYAAAGVPVYWLVDLTTRRVEVFAAPSERGVFEQHHVLGPDDEVELPSLGLRWPVADIVGRQS
jgi:Uma2 family endonuclease